MLRMFIRNSGNIFVKEKHIKALGVIAARAVIEFMYIEYFKTTQKMLRHIGQMQEIGSTCWKFFLDKV